MRLLFLLLSAFLSASLFSQQPQWVEYRSAKQPAKGNIVFVSGDEEYRSEEALPMLAQILAKQHGFNCTVLFSIDPSNGTIDATNLSNIPGLEKLGSADLMVIFTRFRELPDQQMQYIDEYLKAGKPVIGLRTATHAFNYKKNPGSKFAHYDFQSKSEKWQNGFGKRVLGETWVSHHGDHGKEGTRALIEGTNAKHAVLNGVKDIWCATDVYTIDILPADAHVLLYGQPTKGMSASSPVNLAKSIMPVAWTTTYEIESGKKGRVFASTMGASIDLLNEDLRRLLVNACYWAMGLEEEIPKKADVEFVTPYRPTMFGFDNFRKGTFPSKYMLK